MRVRGGDAEPGAPAVCIGEGLLTNVHYYGMILSVLATYCCWDVDSYAGE
jgi:hypothetical protein